MERLLWRGTILLLRLFGDFPPVFLFGSKIPAHSTKPAPPFLNLSVRTAQPCSSPAPRRASSHPLQNRVPRGAGHLWRSAAPVSAPRLGRCWALPTGEQHPSRQARLSPSAPAKNSATAFAVALFFVIERNVLATRHGCAARSACRGGLQPGGLRPGPTEAAAETSPSLDFLLAFRVFSSGFTRSQLFPSSPAPETHPVSPFLAFSGCVFLFFVVFRLQNFCPSFCAFCRIVVTS